MDRRQLVAFVTLAEELSFSRAAVRLRMTQPALSMLTAKLEEELEVRLFHRTKRTVSLTEPGKVFLDETRLTLLQMDIAQTMGCRPSRAPRRGVWGYGGAARMVPAILARGGPID